MKILVTGGAGFIGSHLTKRLVENGHEVIVLDLLSRGNKILPDVVNKVKLVHGDVRDYNLVRELSKGCSYIFHLAAVLGVDIVADSPIETMETEVIGMKNVCEAALFNGVEKVIYASTSGIYGHSAIEKSVTEDIIVDPRTSYAIAKRYNEIYLKALYEEKGLNSVSLRFFNVYGIGQDTRMVIPRFIQQALNNDAITVFGNGEQTRDFTYIDDTIEATVMLAEKSKGCEIYNVANENELSILELAKTIIRLTNSKSLIHNIEAPRKRYDYEVGRRVGSSTKMFNLIGFKPQTSLEIGLSKILESVKS